VKTVIYRETIERMSGSKFSSRPVVLLELSGEDGTGIYDALPPFLRNHFMIPFWPNPRTGKEGKSGFCWSLQHH